MSNELGEEKVPLCTVRKMEELLEHVTAVLFWLFSYTTRHHIPLDSGIQHHIKRIKSILIEMEDRNQSPLLGKVHPISDESFHDDDPTETTQNSSDSPVKSTPDGGGLFFCRKSVDGDGA